MFEIIRDIGAITRQIQKTSNGKFRQIGLDNNAFLYVIRVYEQPGMFLAELADALKIDRTTSFRTIQRLAAKGYLEVKVDENDRRLRRVYVTSKGSLIYPELHAFERACSDKLVAKLSTEEQAQLKVLLSKLVI